MHAAHRVATFARQHLKAILPLSGGVLYSAASTLQPGEVYLLGHNPGGDPTNPKLPTINRSLDELPSKTTNSYLDTVWSGRKYVGQAPLQRRICWLLIQLGLDPRSVAASNLIFVRSRDAAGSQFEEYSRLCWPVHEEILQVVKPRLVIVYGNSSRSPYRFLRDQFGIDADETYSSGHGTWMCRSFVVPGRFRVVGVPHISRYDISAHDDVVDWIKSLAKPGPPTPTAQDELRRSPDDGSRPVHAERAYSRR